MRNTWKVRSVPRVGIVILNWRRPDDTMACLRSLDRLDYPAFEVVVVDNGSGDGSPPQIREQFPHVTVIENGRNLGFAGGCNVGMNILLDRSVDYVLLLNDDTEVAPDLLRVLVDVGESDPSIGVVGPKIYYHHQPNVIWSAGGMISPHGEPRHLRIDQPDDGSQEQPSDVDYVTGCGMLVKRSVIEISGALDERFFAYFEETEWCARARRAGFRVVYAPQAQVWHKIPCAARASSLYLYLMARNRLLFLRCSGASSWTIARATLQLLRTAMSWAIRPEHRDKRAFSGALVLGIRHYMSGRFGAPPTHI